MTRKWEDEELFSQRILDFFYTADHVVANVEGALFNAKDDGSRGVVFHCMDTSKKYYTSFLSWKYGEFVTFFARHGIRPYIGCVAFGRKLIDGIMKKEKL